MLQGMWALQGHAMMRMAIEYLTSSPLFSFLERGGVVLLHNAVVVPACGGHQSINKVGMRAAPAAMSLLQWAAVVHAAREKVGTSNEAAYFGSSMCLPLGIGSLVAPTRARIDRGMFGLLQQQGDVPSAMICKLWKYTLSDCAIYITSTYLLTRLAPGAGASECTLASSD